MTTIPARLARTTAVSTSPEHARQRVLKLYRHWYRACAPEICQLFGLNVTPSYIRSAIRHQFEKNRYVSDPKVIDILLLKGHQEYQETLNAWKQESHILGILLKNNDRPQRTFLQKFYEGRDEDAVLPAASGL
ncbi:hypothetical protein EW146_g10161 [Bondarzewia mesenterica]|uniref:Complex 1 LYR protein domain-containing protein n=1 Tax=Bondarzewia mesenterica TaxID=1095465 RepID=A0A4S4KZU6_9AGAM|nr:hypothetical protein EW146_g10161 [Bondarzewia mesenterica]